MHNWGNKFKLTRIAPTPSGYLHLGNALSFALTAAIAHNTGANILLRIDDLDRERVEQEYVHDVFETLDFLNINWHLGPRNVNELQKNWSQLHRLHLYKPALDELAQNKEVFACTCTRRQLQTPGYACTCLQKQLPLDTPNSAWRLFTDDKVVKVNTLTKGVVEIGLPAELKNFVVKKKDGYPAYQLSSLIDDVNFGVDLIVRGEDLWSSTIAQHYLASTLGLDAFTSGIFHHHTLLTIAGAKLSKSAGSTSIQHMRALGVTRANVYHEIGAALGIAKPCTGLDDISNNLLL